MGQRLLAKKLVQRGPAPENGAPALSRSLTRLAQMVSMPETSWLRLFIWLALGLAVYFLYAWRAGRRGEIAPA